MPDEPDRTTDVPPDAPSSRVVGARTTGLAYWGGSVVVLVGLTTWLYGPHVFDSHWILNQPNHDWAQAVWFLAWPAYALRHGLDPLFSTWQNYPSGINLMNNTSMPLLGILLAPLTWVAGPVVSYSVALRLGMVTSALAAQFVARRLGLSRAASALAGLLYACSAMEVVEGNGHCSSRSSRCLRSCCTRPHRGCDRPARAWRAGLVVGALLAAQALISLEVALLTGVTLVVGGAVGALVCRRELTAERRRALAGLGGVAVASLGVLLTAPLAIYFGRGHFWGPSHPTLEIYRANLVSIVVPGRLTWVSPFVAHLPTALAYRRENGAYLGVPLLAVLGYVAVRAWHRQLVRVAVWTSLVLLVVSLGTRLDVTGASTGIPLPFALLAHVPFLDSLSPVRSFVVIGLLVGLLAGLGYDLTVAWARERPGSRRRALVLIATAVVLVSLAPARAYPTSQTDGAGWLASAEGRALVPDGSVVLEYPYPSVDDSSALLTQAVDGFRYRLVGGQGVVATSKPNVHAVVPLEPLELPSVFLRYSTGALFDAPIDTIFGLPPLPRLDARTARAFRTFVASNGVTRLVVLDTATTPVGVLRYLRAAFGLPTVADGGSVVLWSFARRA